MIENAAQDYEKLARDAATARLAAGGDPSNEVALCACEMISRFARTAKDGRQAIIDVVRGCLGAMLLAGHDVTDAGLRILRSLPNITLVVRADPQEVITWVMEGMAAVAVMAGDEVRVRIQERLETEYMGSGTVFSSLCDQVVKK